MRQFIVMAFIPILLVTLYSGCAGRVTKNPDSLYYRLGGHKMVGKIVTDTVNRWARDKRVMGTEPSLKNKFKKVDKVKLKRSLFSFLCMASEGPCSFSKSELQDAMKGLKISQLEWYYLLEGIVRSLNKNNVPTMEQNGVLGIAYDLQDYVVED